MSSRHSSTPPLSPIIVSDQPEIPISLSSSSLHKLSSMVAASSISSSDPSTTPASSVFSKPEIDSNEVDGTKIIPPIEGESYLDSVMSYSFDAPSNHFNQTTVNGHHNRLSSVNDDSIEENLNADEIEDDEENVENGGGMITFAFSDAF